MHYVELVPRNLEELKALAIKITQTYPKVTGINIPDILRLTVRSHDATAALLDIGIDAIPHIRCIDREIPDTLAIIDILVEKGLKSVLLIKGDPPTDLTHQTYDISPLEVIEAVKKSFPTLNVYCGIDPYRTSLKKELSYCKKKLKAGADGFFTQPIFDPKLALIYLEQLTETQLFIGLSPVCTEISLTYWKEKNHAIFPKNFKLDLPFNQKLGKELITITESTDQNIYMMPIRVPALEYLPGIYS